MYCHAFLPARDPSLPINRNEITRFPHAVLEVKLSLGEGQQSPAWVQVCHLTNIHLFCMEEISRSKFPQTEVAMLTG